MDCKERCDLDLYGEYDGVLIKNAWKFKIKELIPHNIYQVRECHFLRSDGV